MSGRAWRRRRLVVAGVVAGVLVVVAGCQQPCKILMSQTYIANRDGAYYVGLRCTTDLVGVVVVWADDATVLDAAGIEPTAADSLWAAMVNVPPGSVTADWGATSMTWEAYQQLPDGDVSGCTGKGLVR